MPSKLEQGRWLITSPRSKEERSSERFTIHEREFIIRTIMVRVHSWTRIIIFFIAAITSTLFFFVADSATNLNSNPQINCSKTCVAQKCNSIGIRYGKFCGVGWTGCPGQKPCDDLDACCKTHDYCVEKKGLMSVPCHEKFKSCIKKVQKSGKTGFSQECPYETAMPTMIQGMDMAILLSQFGTPKDEL